MIPATRMMTKTITVRLTVRGMRPVFSLLFRLFRLKNPSLGLRCAPGLALPLCPRPPAAAAALCAAVPGIPDVSACGCGALLCESLLIILSLWYAGQRRLTPHELKRLCFPLIPDKSITPVCYACTPFISRGSRIIYPIPRFVWITGTTFCSFPLSSVYVTPSIFLRR